MLGRLLDESLHRCVIASVLLSSWRKAISALILSVAIEVFYPGTVGAQPASLPAKDCSYRETFRDIPDLQKTLLAHQKWLDFMALTKDRDPRPLFPRER